VKVHVGGRERFAYEGESSFSRLKESAERKMDHTRRWRGKNFGGRRNSGAGHYCLNSNEGKKSAFKQEYEGTGIALSLEGGIAVKKMNTVQILLPKNPSRN